MTGVQTCALPIWAVGVGSVAWRLVASTRVSKDEKEAAGLLMERGTWLAFPHRWAARADSYRCLVYLACLVVPTALLSILPHQEPRFLVALVTPLVLLLPSIPIFKTASRASRSRRRQFWVRPYALNFWSQMCTDHSLNLSESLDRPLSRLYHPFRLPSPRRTRADAAEAQRAPQHFATFTSPRRPQLSDPLSRILEGVHAPASPPDFPRFRITVSYASRPSC